MGSPRSLGAQLAGTLSVRWLPAVLLPLLAAACGAPSVPPERTLVERAVTLIGGADHLLALRSLVVEGNGSEARIGQAIAPFGEPPSSNIIAWRIERDLTSDRMRVATRREPDSAGPDVEPSPEASGLDGDVAYDEVDGRVRRTHAGLVARRRLEMLHHPVVLLRAALDEGARLANRRVEGGFVVVDLVTAAGDEVTLGFDPAYGTLTMAWSPLADPILGDTRIETAFYRYAEQDGLSFPRRIVSKLDRYPLRDLRVTRNLLNVDVTATRVSGQVRAVPAPLEVPVPHVTAERIISGAWRLAGESHHSVLIELTDQLWLFEVPMSEARTLAVIARARQLRPGKPLTHAIVSHHHFDHLAGVRASVSEGLTIVAQRGSDGLIRDLVARRHTRVPDALERQRRALQLTLVDSELLLNDPANPLYISRGPDTPHAQGVLLAFLARRWIETLTKGRQVRDSDRIYAREGPGVIVHADLFGGGFSSPMDAAALYGNLIVSKGYEVGVHIPVHGRRFMQADLIKALP